MLRPHGFSPSLRDALTHARAEAQRLGCSYIGTEHMLLGLIECTDAAQILAALGADPHRLRKAIEESAPSERGTTNRTGNLPYTPGFAALVRIAKAQARGYQARGVESGHMLLALLLEERGKAGLLLRDAGLSTEDVIRYLKTGAGKASRFVVQVDDKSDKLIYEQIVAQVQEAIATGKLAPGDRLPAVRQMADDLGIAPGTVSRAYSLLEESGAVTTEGARGTFVARREPASTGSQERAAAVHALLRQVVVAAFHLGATAEDLRKELEQAMKDIFGAREAA